MPSIEYNRVMTEIVYINMPSPKEPTEGMSGQDIMHGLLGEFYRAENEEVKKFTREMCLKWNVHYREKK